MGCGDSKVAPSNRSRAGQPNRNNTTINSTVTDNVKDPDPNDKETILVEKLDLKVSTNTKAHHTEEFDITHEKSNFTDLKGSQLVIRRGQSFDISIEFNRPYDKNKDDLRLAFSFGPKLNARKGTLVEVILSGKDKPNTWGAMILSTNDNSVTLRIMTPANCAVGKWKLMIDVIKATDVDITLYRMKHPDPIYILFNPWCKDDEVFLDDDKLLDEYILNEGGDIYRGNKKNISSTPWTFGQFSGHILDCTMYLLEQAKMSTIERGNPIMISRKLSALLNAQDDNGVLVGNWSGKYSDGISPLNWTGSVAILEQYYKQKRPVKFGQCWVFSGILTTVCRAVGIPCRSVTNFSSAHDTDASITIDTSFSHDGKRIEKYNSDSVWNFHVWNDVWMARPDLPNGYSGWQAIDTTPQERSNDVYCMGPMSLVAIKRGETHLSYDGPFVFAEVNSDIVHWMLTKEGRWEKIRQIKNSVGKSMSTKLPNSDDKEDVTDQYKYKEGSEENEAAVLKAMARSSTLERPLYKENKKEVTFEILVDDVFYGDNVKVKLNIQNSSNEARTLNGKLEFMSMYYTGVPLAVLDRLDLSNTTVEAGKDLDINFDIPVDKYLVKGKLADHCICQVTVVCIVKETNQSYVDQEEVRLRKPKLEFRGPDSGKIGKTFEIEVRFDNPLPVALTNCELRVEGRGLQEPTVYKQAKVPGKATFVGNLGITPTKEGKKRLVVYFNSDEISAVTGVKTIFVS